MASLTNDNTEYLSIDEILRYVGGYGRFQKLLNALLFLICIPMAYPIIIMYFCTLNSPWRCTQNSTVCTSSEIFKNTDFSRCKMNRTDWEYTKPKGFSIITQFDLRCDQQWIVDMSRSVSFIGWGIGAIVLGWLGDKYGRKKLLLPSVAATLLITLLTPLIPNLYAIVFFRSLSCFFIPGATLSCFILISELVDEKRRAFAGILIYMTVPLSCCFLVPKAYLIGEWKTLCIVCSVPYVLVLAFVSFIPESIQWLSENGRTEEVMMVVQKIARWNKTVLPSNIKIAPPRVNMREHTSSVLDIFRTKKLALYSFVNGYLWLTTAMGYFGVLMAADDLGGSEYLDFFIMQFIDLPTTFVAIYICDKFGRKRASLFTILAGGIGLLAVAPFPTTGTLLTVRIGFGMVGKLMISTTFNCIYLWTMELYPINIRAKGMGWVQIAARTGAALAPWISEWLSPFGKGAPFLAMGIPLMLALCVGLVLPETQHKSSEVIDCTVVSNSNVKNTLEEKL